MYSNFEPTPRSELDRPPFEPGQYKFKIEDIEKKMSKNGNEYHNLKLTFFNQNHRTITIYDSLTLVKNMHWKLAHFFDSIQMPGLYDSGSINWNAIKNKIGYAELVMDEYEGKKRLKIKDYIKEIDQPMDIPSHEEEPDDDIFF